MSTSKNMLTHRDECWGDLGLRYQRSPVRTRHELEVEQAVLAVLAVLAAHPPIGFAGDAAGSAITARQIDRLVERAIEGAERVAEHHRETAAEERRRLGWARVEEALAAPDTDRVVPEGRWAGFRRGEAVAWCWNLFQYEPHGFVHPG